MAGGVAHLRHDLQALLARRQHPALGAEQRPDPVQAVDEVSGALPEGRDQQVAHRMAGQLPSAEPVLHDRAPRTAPGVVAAERGQRHPQVPGRGHADVAAQAPAGPAVVGHPDDGRQAVGDPAQGPQAHRQAVAAAEGHGRS